MDTFISGFRLERTCWASPEQYDVYNPDGEMVGYLRLRHGRFTVECPDVGGKVVYVASPAGDGIFATQERVRYLRNAIKAIEDYCIIAAAESGD